MYTVNWQEVGVGMSGEVLCSVRVERHKQEKWSSFWQRACAEWDSGRQLASVLLSSCSPWLYAGRVNQLALVCQPQKWVTSLWLLWPWGAAEMHFGVVRPVGTREWLLKAHRAIERAHLKAYEKYRSEHQLKLPLD